jgi:lipopolysaccharide export LptBFGC system permease protein LptF
MMAYTVKLAMSDKTGMIVTGLGFLFSLLAIIFGFIHLAVGSIITLWYAVGFSIIALLMSIFLFCIV